MPGTCSTAKVLQAAIWPVATLVMDFADFHDGRAQRAQNTARTTPSHSVPLGRLCYCAAAALFTTFTMVRASVCTDFPHRPPRLRSPAPHPHQGVRCCKCANITQQQRVTVVVVAGSRLAACYGPAVCSMQRRWCWQDRCRMQHNGGAAAPNTRTRPRRAASPSKARVHTHSHTTPNNYRPTARYRRW